METQNISTADNIEPTKDGDKNAKVIEFMEENITFPMIINGKKETFVNIEQMLNFWEKQDSEKKIPIVERAVLEYRSLWNFLNLHLWKRSNTAMFPPNLWKISFSVIC